MLLWTACSAVYFNQYVRKGVARRAPTGCAPVCRAGPITFQLHRPWRKAEPLTKGLKHSGVGSATPCQLSAISYQLSAISYQLSAISYQLSTISYQLSAISYQLSAFTYGIITFSNWGPVAQRQSRRLITARS
jgi:hypothetical protein